MKLNIKDTMPVEQFFLDALQSTIEAVSAKDKRLPSRAFKPSSMQCSRKAYYHLVATPRDSDAGMSSNLVGIVESGTDRHTRLQEWIMQIKHQGYDIEYVDIIDYLKDNPNEDIEVIGRDGAEVKLFNHRLNMSFMCDGILNIKGKYYVLEIKTESTFKFRYRNGVADEHIRQATCYFLNFGLPVIFLYENRDFSDKKAYLFEPKPQHGSEVLRAMLEANIGVDTKIAPEIPENIWQALEKYFDKKKYTQKTRDAYREGNWRELINTCKYCDYRERCKQEEEKRKVNDGQG